MIDYKKELLGVLQNNTISTMPSQELIDSDVEIVKALWKNFEPGSDKEYDEGFRFSKWYKDCGWGTKLQKYNKEFKLWEELLESKFYSGYLYGSDTSYNFLLTEEFKKDFPEIVNHFLSDNDTLIKLFNKTKNKTFFELLDLDLNKKEEVMKLFLINSNLTIEQSLIDKYQNDEQFLTALLENKPFYFSKLSQENKNNQKYIDLAIKELDTFSQLSEEKKAENFKNWCSTNMQRIKPSHLKDLNTIQKATVFFYNQNLLASAFSKTNKENEKIATILLTKDFQKFISMIPNDLIFELAKNQESMNKLKPQLDILSQSNKHFAHVSGNTKIFFLIKQFPNLEEKLNNNVYFELYKDSVEFKNKQEKNPTEYRFKDFQWLKEKAKKLVSMYEQGKLTKEEGDNFISGARGFLDRELLKELKLPRNALFDFMKSEILKEELEKMIPEKSSPKSKNKI